MQIVSEKDVSEITDTELCLRFDNDILYDCHQLRTRVSRSDAARKLRLNAHGMLPAIVAHLENHPKLTGRSPELPGLVEDLCLGWGLLLNWFAIDLGTLAQAPEHLIDTPGWIVWARKQVGS